MESGWMALFWTAVFLIAYPYVIFPTLLAVISKAFGSEHENCPVEADQDLRSSLAHQPRGFQVQGTQVTQVLVDERCDHQRVGARFEPRSAHIGDGELRVDA